MNRNVIKSIGYVKKGGMFNKMWMIKCSTHHGQDMRKGEKCREQNRRKGNTDKSL